MTKEKFDELFEEGQFAANWLQLVSDNTHFIVPAETYDVSCDKRILIPFIKNQKIGFVNNSAEIVVSPKYDIILGEVYTINDFVKVGIKFSVEQECSNGEIRIVNKCKWGVIDSTGKLIIEPHYVEILISDDGSLFTLRDFKNKYCVIDIYGNIIVPFEQFDVINGFTNGYARIKKESRWGIINKRGEIVLPTEYDDIWTFYNKNQLRSTKVIKGRHGSRFFFDTGRLVNNMARQPFDNRYGKNYEEYAGSYAQDIMGYSDDVINDAFDGEPDAYWNID